MNAESPPSIHALTTPAFVQDMIAGLSGTPKKIPCKWFYDHTGSCLFEAITRTPEYYLTRAELRVLRSIAPHLPSCIPGIREIVELGSGSSMKTRLLLEALPKLERYVPADISEEYLLSAAAQLGEAFPRLNIAPLAADFTQLSPHPDQDGSTCLVFFPGSTIGNFSRNESQALLDNIRQFAGLHAWLLIGVDMTQDNELLFKAYNDAEGITERFNKNLLVRANRELGATFNIDDFDHHAFFNAQEERIEMHLVSQRPQLARVNDTLFEFAKGESIHTENSYKYPADTFEALARASGWNCEHLWLDEGESDFGVFLMRAVEPH